MSSGNVLCGATFIAFTLPILLRWCISLHPYSGQGTPPMFGDYEAQRHWMEITYNLPLKEWYVNTTYNDLMYWGLDYPPITAYHSYICGYFASQVNPAYVALNSSRGYESYEHKLFMRATVLVADLLIYMPAVWWFFSYKRPASERCSLVRSLYSVGGGACYTSSNTSGGGGMSNINSAKGDGQQVPDSASLNSQVLAIYLALIYPGLILIDYGHFQYNNISLGLTVAAIAAMCREFELTASALFCFALNYKQMELYHSLPFFCYLLGLCLPRAGKPFYISLVKLLKIGIVVILSFLLVWLPFLESMGLTFKVLHRLFPLARGVFEDKVSNIWCSLNVIYKLHNAFTNLSMAKICMCTTFFAVIPSSVDLILRPNVRKFLIGLINSSLAFFLFSYQVHEKSILLAAIPVILYLPVEPLTCFWFLFLSTFSMLPLLVRDGLFLAYVATTIFYALSVYLTVDFSFRKVKYFTTNTGVLVFKSTVERNRKPVRTCADHDEAKAEILPIMSNQFLQFVFVVSILGCVILTVCISAFQPPIQYPDLYPLLISMYSAGHFILFFLYFNYRQFTTVLPSKE